MCYSLFFREKGGDVYTSFVPMPKSTSLCWSTCFLRTSNMWLPILHWLHTSVNSGQYYIHMYIMYKKIIFRTYFNVTDISGVVIKLALLFLGGSYCCCLVGECSFLVSRISEHLWNIVPCRWINWSPSNLKKEKYYIRTAPFWFVGALSLLVGSMKSVCRS